ncbi:MAG: cation transporter [Clostridia bacterium]|nr:cation transporter [Clostridia bacterium]
MKDRKNTSSACVRRAYGVLCGAFGIILNILLSAAKFFAGTVSGSIAVTADAFNNLTDAAASIVELVGFRLSGNKPDPKHPFGHGRIEYIAGLIVSVVTIVVGFELGKSSVIKIIDKETSSFSAVAVAVLSVSVAVKLYMAYYNYSIGRKISSPAMKAVFYDSLSDCAATSAVLAAMIINRVSGLNIDGYCGCVIALFIMFSGVRSVIETANPLLGTSPSKDLTEKIEKTVMSYPGIFGIHDLIVHDYGPGRVMVSLHVEVRSDAKLMEMHGIVDGIERELQESCGCSAVIHIDPIEVDDELTTALRQSTSDIAASICPGITIHDFRIVSDAGCKKIIFDAVVPFSAPISEKEVKNRFQRELSKIDSDYIAVIDIDRSDGR